MDSNEILDTIREVTSLRNSFAYDMIKERSPDLARLIVEIDDLDRGLSTGTIPMPVAWDAGYHATTDEMARQESEGELECEMCGREDLATTSPPRCNRHVAVT